MSGTRTASALLILACAALAPAVGAEALWERFLGSYVGQAITETDGSHEMRDLQVDISKTKRGFRVRWTAVTRRSDGSVKRKQYSVDFTPSRREGVFASEMRSNLFGKREALDPMRGDPYVWARIEGDTLSVFSLLITDVGSYSMQVYHRTLIEEGLDLDYTRFEEGEVTRTVNGTLRRRR